MKLDTMRSRLACFAKAAIAVVASTLLIPATAIAQSTTPPYYPPGTYTPFTALEAVNPDGSSSFTWPTNGSPITVMGIVLNNPSDMLDTTANQNTIPWNLGGQWQIFIQAYSDSTVGGTRGDFGGAEVWMGQCYGNLQFIGDPNNVYTNSQWNTVVADLNNPPLWPSSGTISLQEGSAQSNSSPAVWPSSGTVPLKAGDVVAITSYGLEYEGMVNMNQQHMVGNPLSLSVLETGAQLPAPTVTTLPQLMNSSSVFYFDPTRQTGAEHLQGTLVQLDGVHVSSGTWAPNSQVVLSDATGRQMILNIGNNPDLAVAPTGTFNITGIEDQESTSVSPTDGYTLWVTDSSNITPRPNPGGTFAWTGSNGSWNAAGNWDVGNKPQGAGDAAIFGGSLTTAATVTLDGPQKIGCLTFANANAATIGTNAATTGYTLAAGSSGALTLDNSGSTAVITVISGSHAITAPVALADSLDVSVSADSTLTLSGGISENSPGMSLTLDGGGVLILSGTDTYSGGTTVDAGTLILTSNSAIADGTSLTVGSGGVFIFDPATAAASTYSSAATQVSSVPEPGSLALLAAAVAGLVWKCRTRRRPYG